MQSRQSTFCRVNLVGDKTPTQLPCNVDLIGRNFTEPSIHQGGEKYKDSVDALAWVQIKKYEERSSVYLSSDLFLTRD